MPTAAPSTFNAVSAWLDRFPPDRDLAALATPQGAAYTWRDLDRASAMLAQWLLRLELPPAAVVAAQVNRSVEALALTLAVWRCGRVFLPVHTDWTPEALAPLLQASPPAVLVCRPERFAALSTLAFQRGVGHVFTLGADQTGSLLQRATQQPDRHDPVPVAPDHAALLPSVGGPLPASGASTAPVAPLAAGSAQSHAQLQALWPTVLDVWRAFTATPAWGLFGPDGRGVD